MPTNVTPVGTFDTTIPAPDDGEDIDRASLVQFVQPAVNRSEFLKDTVQNTQKIIFQRAVSAVGGLTLTNAFQSVISLAVPGGVVLEGDFVSCTYSQMSLYATVGGFDRVYLGMEIGGVLHAAQPNMWIDTLQEEIMQCWTWGTTVPAGPPATFACDAQSRVQNAVGNIDVVMAGLSMTVTRDIGAIP